MKPQPDKSLRGNVFTLVGEGRIHPSVQVWDEHSRFITLAEKMGRRQWREAILAALVGTALWVVLFFLALGVVGVAYGHRGEAKREGAGDVVALVGFFGLILVPVVTVFMFEPRGEVIFYTSERKEQILLRARDAQRLQLNSTSFNLSLADGQVIARLRGYCGLGFSKHKQWLAFDPSGELICTSKEDWIPPESLWDRVSESQDEYGGGPPTAPMNVFFMRGNEEIGELTYDPSLFGHYRLDLSGDPNYIVDRRVVLALAVIILVVQGSSPGETKWRAVRREKTLHLPGFRLKGPKL